MNKVESIFFRGVKKAILFIHKYRKQKFLLTFLAFIILMLFVDNDNFITQYSRYRHIGKLDKEIEYYQKKLIKTKEEQKALNNNKAYLEKFLREKYFMKKKDEDLYIFVEE